MCPILCLSIQDLILKKVVGRCVRIKIQNNNKKSLSLVYSSRDKFLTLKTKVVQQDHSSFADTQDEFTR